MSHRKKTHERRLLPAIVFVIACVALAGLLLQHFLGESPRKTSPAPAPTNQSAAPLIFITTNQAETLDPEDQVVALVTKGNELLAQGNHAAAAQKYAEAVSISPDQEDLHYNLAIALGKLGRTEDAKKHYEEALLIFPEYAEAHNNLGNLLMNENKFEAAIERFREAIKHSPENASFHNNLGTAFGRQGKPAEAMAEFEQAVKLAPDYVEARVNLANTLLMGGRVDEASIQLNEALRLKPDFPPALQVLQRVRQRQVSQPP